MKTSLLDIAILKNWDILINENADNVRENISRRIYTIINSIIADEILNAKDEEKENILKKHKII